MRTLAILLCAFFLFAITLELHSIHLAVVALKEAK